MQCPAARRSNVGFVAATIGNALEFYDFLTYALFAIQIGHSFFPSAYGSLMLSLATFGAGFITRPIGGFVLGIYADRVGRRPAMLLCLVLIGASITAMALIPSYARIGTAAPILAVIARLVQGFSLGGELGSNTAFLAEAVNPARRGAAAVPFGLQRTRSTRCTFRHTPAFWPSSRVTPSACRSSRSAGGCPIAMADGRSTSWAISYC